MFKLYYLQDQSGDINGDKYFVELFSTLAAAQNQAVVDGVAHYSVEQEQDDGTNYEIVFIV